jgi:hypothetical protein
VISVGTDGEDQPLMLLDLADAERLYPEALVGWDRVDHGLDVRDFAIVTRQRLERSGARAMRVRGAVELWIKIDSNPIGWGVTHAALWRGDRWEIWDQGELPHRRTVREHEGRDLLRSFRHSAGTLLCRDPRRTAACIRHATPCIPKVTPTIDPLGLDRLILQG